MWSIVRTALTIVSFGAYRAPEPPAAQDSCAEIDPAASCGPGMDRPAAIEGSTEWTYLNPGPELRAQVARLSALGTVIRYGPTDSDDLVADLWGGFQGGEFPKLTQVFQFLALQTLEELAKQGDGALKDKSFGLGQIDIILLERARGMRRLVQLLTLGYPDWQPLIREFDSTDILGANFSNRTIGPEELQALSAPRASSIGGEPDKRSRFDLMRIVILSLEQLGETVSYNQLKFLNPFVPALANCREDQRVNILRKILADEFPFNRENMDAWHSEIGSAMA